MKKILETFKEKLWLGPVVLGTALRLFGITASSIWHDEGYTMWLLRYNFLEIIKRDMRDVHPPGYYLISKLWVSIFGTSAFSIRFLSLVFSVGIIYLTFLIVKRLFDARAAFWSALFVAFSPFMIRFGQEARMYGVIAFFTTLATYFLIRFLQEKDSKQLIWYTLSMILAVYNQYYGFFVVISHWLIVAIATPGFFKFHWKESFKAKLGIFDFWWWVANFTILASYLVWFPVAFKQVTRVSGGYWIKPEWITIQTIPNSVLQFLTYTHMDSVYALGIAGKAIYWLVVLALMLSGFWLYKNKEKRAEVTGLFIYGYLPMVLVFTLSKLKTPVYQDRYFPFSAIAIFIIWGTLVAMIKNKKARIAAGAAVLLVMCIGIGMMRYQTDHQMKQLSDAVKANVQPSDTLLSGELYTFLDGSYYLGYGKLKWLSGPVDGYGETSLFYDQTKTYLYNPDDLKYQYGRVWLIGKTGKDYFNDPRWNGWYKSETITKGDVEAILYTR